MLRPTYTMLKDDAAPLPSGTWESVRVIIAHHAAHPSSVVLPVVPGVAVTTRLPHCTALRGEPRLDGRLGTR